MTVSEVTYRLSPPPDAQWPRLSVAVMADLHACKPFMGPDRIEALVAQTNAMGADLILLLGDYAGHVLGGRGLPPGPVVNRLACLSAPLGVWGVFGNHDWRDDPAAQRLGQPTKWHSVFARAGIRMLCNEAVRIKARGAEFTLAGLESQRALQTRWRRKVAGLDDWGALEPALDPQGFTLLMAHEPDIFPELPDHVGLTVSGHTHGGQILPFGRPLVVPSVFGARYAYGHVREGRKQLVVSGGLGYSGLPLRWRRPPELTRIEIG